VVYVGSFDDNLYAIEARTGRLKWSYTVGGLIESASPTLAHGTVYVGAGVTLYALDEQTGALKWTYTTGDIGFGIYSAPAVLNGTLYLSVQDGNLYALDAQTGQLKWSYTTGDSIRASAVVVNGVVYVGSDDDTLYAFHLKA
jgi:outer membrane protein assembly factor BamB